MKYAFKMEYGRQENQKYFYFLIFAMAVVMAFTFKFYLTQRKENQALRLKVMMANKERRRPKPWGRLFASQPVRTATTPAKTIPKNDTANDTVTTNAAATTRPAGSPAGNDNELIKNQDTETLAGEMNERMGNIKQLDLPQIARTIEIADELILREPDTYSAYKAKLIALLTREGKYNIPADDNDVNSLLEDMARFDISSDKVLQKEAALISNANADISTLEQSIIETKTKRSEIETQMAQLGPNNPDYRALDARRAVLSMQEEDATGKLATLQDQVQQGSFPPDNYVNEDVVQIPFMRMMARGDYASAADNAEAFVQQFPASPVGYYYLVIALEKLGRKDDAVDAIARSRLGSTEQNALLERLSRERVQDPKRYWEKLSF
jgi:hypothetical protein